MGKGCYLPMAFFLKLMTITAAARATVPKIDQMIRLIVVFRGVRWA
jgi:hypothetical protein